MKIITIGRSVFNWYPMWYIDGFYLFFVLQLVTKQRNIQMKSIIDLSYACSITQMLHLQYT